MDEFGIRQASITIHFGEEILKANLEITDEQLIERVNMEGKLPTTAAPSPGDFVEVYQEAFDGGADMKSFASLSAEMSALPTRRRSREKISFLEKKSLSLIPKVSAWDRDLWF